MVVGMKTAVSIEDDVYAGAERLAQQLSFNRSQLYTDALRLYIRLRGGDLVTATLDTLYDEHEPSTANVGRQLIEAGDWQW